MRHAGRVGARQSRSQNADVACKRVVGGGGGTRCTYARKQSRAVAMCATTARAAAHTCALPPRLK
eukprot:2706120-Prymnesium_polylepis.1